jgi:hypothetical protein
MVLHNRRILTFTGCKMKKIRHIQTDITAQCETTAAVPERPIRSSNGRM